MPKNTKKKMYVEWDKGTGPANSRTHAGKRSPLVFDAAGNLVGHVVLSDIDDEDEDDVSYYDDSPDPARDEEVSLEEALAGLAALVLAVAAASPHVKRWWDAQVRPAMRTAKRSARNRLAKARRPRRRARQVDVTNERAAIPLPPVPVDAVPEEERPWLSGDEVQQRLLVALAARALSDEQLRIILNARIGDADGDLDLKGALEQAIPREVKDQVTLMVEANPGMLDDFTKVFWSERAGGGRAPVPRSIRRPGALPPSPREE